MMKFKMAVIVLFASLAMASVAVAGSCGDHAKKAAKSGCGSEVNKTECCSEDASKCCGAKADSEAETAE